MAVPLFAPRRVPQASVVAEAPAAKPEPAKKLREGTAAVANGSVARPVHTYGREAAALLLLASALYTVLALGSYVADPMRPEVVGPNWVGPVGEAFSGFASGAFGVAAWTFPLELALLSGPLLGGKPSRFSVARFGGDIVVLVILAALAHVAFPASTAFGAMPLGGAVGELFGEVMRSLFSAIGSYIIGLTIVSLILVQRATFSFIELMARLRAFAETLPERGLFGLGAILRAIKKAREIEQAGAKVDEKARAGVASKHLTPSPTDVVITVLTDDSVQHRKDKPFEVEESDKPLRKKRGGTTSDTTDAKESAPVSSSRSSNHGDAIVLGTTTPVPSETTEAPKLVVKVEPAVAAKPVAVKISRAKEPKATPVEEVKPVVEVGFGAKDAEGDPKPQMHKLKIARAEQPKEETKSATVKIALRAEEPKVTPAPAAKVNVKVVVSEDKPGPSIVAPRANPEAIVAFTSESNASDDFFGAAEEPTSDELVAREVAREAPAPVAREVAREVEKPRKVEAVAEPRPQRVAKTVRADVAEVRPEPVSKKKTPTPPPVRVEEPAPESEEEIVDRTVDLDDEEEDETEEDETEDRFLNDEPFVDSETPSPVAPARTVAAKAFVAAPTTATVSKPEPVAKPKEVVKMVPSFGKGFTLPATTMLEPPGDECIVVDEEKLRENASLLEKTLADYGVSGKVEEIHPGPTVTTFEVSPAAGTKVSKVAGLADDLALGLSRKVRIIAPIPGKARIGFELPNDQRVPVSMRELVEDRRFQELKAPLPCVLGRDIVGAPYFADLASMPHVIVAGATGAGKSVGLNVMLVSLLFRKTPADLRLLMIDPKVVELAPFDRIPHMLLPVVTDMKQAANALKWAVDEMERRYQLFATAGTKNIGTYNGWVEKVERGEARPPKPPANAKVAAITAEGLEVEVPAAKDGSDVAKPEKLPYIVIVVDEFADLMMQQGKDVEVSVARLAQKARAAGMHVILATQRPSVDVITGMIKANFPTRIAFRVAQKVDSRTILDEQGAEHLLGRGDMLVKMNGATDTRRVQCPFVSEEEVQRITDFLRAQGEPVYDEDILKPRDEEGKAEDNDTENDPMYDAAVRIVAETRRCSTSWIQRKLGVGYNRAAKMVEAMEMRGIVGPSNGAKDREVLIAPL